jgi:anti-sigma factor RsiW
MNEQKLMAYLDGELNATEQAEAEREIAADPALAEQVRAQQALRARLQAAYAPVLDEPLSQRLLDAVGKPAQVVDLAAARAARLPRRRWQWPEWGAMAACLLAGVVGGQWLLGTNEPLHTERDGSLVARGVLARALSEQLASAPPERAPVRIGTSFVARSGHYCRSFVLERDAPMAGLACREGEHWKLQLVAPAAPPEARGGYRMAGSALPPALLKAIDEQIHGSPLDATAERAARQRGWR